MKRSEAYMKFLKMWKLCDYFLCADYDLEEGWYHMDKNNARHQDWLKLGSAISTDNLKVIHFIVGPLRFSLYKE
jgi:hypothetical protein